MARSIRSPSAPGDGSPEYLLLDAPKTIQEEYLALDPKVLPVLLMEADHALKILADPNLSRSHKHSLYLKSQKRMQRIREIGLRSPEPQGNSTTSVLPLSNTSSIFQPSLSSTPIAKDIGPIFSTSGRRRASRRVKAPYPTIDSGYFGDSQIGFGTDDSIKRGDYAYTDKGPFGLGSVADKVLSIIPELKINESGIEQNGKTIGTVEQFSKFVSFLDSEQDIDHASEFSKKLIRLIASEIIQNGDIDNDVESNLQRLKDKGMEINSDNIKECLSDQIKLKKIRRHLATS